MQPLNLKPTHKLVKNYYEVLGQFGQLEIDHEGAVSSAFQNLLAGCGHQFDLTLSQSLAQTDLSDPAGERGTRPRRSSLSERWPKALGRAMVARISRALSYFF